ncbi:zinc ribbon domain-containing protein [uncultured Adlercreutzia sp.]|uniref:zinc ribbon domain-containing protein n=1 Tax=uncultured Adlercreutzia sp. TaxID=875803 RepID=UPI0025E596A6|nr:zinc ribbon domain-containing protein [uncultured Adlercreutzia sp.]
MFCPKCGNQLPDGSAFCGKCGARLAGPAAAGSPGIERQGHGPCPTGPGSPSASPRPAAAAAAFGLSGVQIAAVVLAAVAAVFALMPWFVTSSSLQFAGETASAVSSFLTMGTYSTAHFEESYAMFSIMDFVRDFASYVGSSYSGGGIIVPVLGAWAVGLVAMVAGAVLLVLRKGTALLVAGAAVLMLDALFYSFMFYGQFVEGDFAVSCVNPLACALACLAVIVLALAGGSAKKKAAAGRAA